MGPPIGMLLYLPAVVVAFLVTLLELTEVVALVFALGADQKSIRTGAYGATTGVLVVGLLALGFGAVLDMYSQSYLLAASAAVLAAFGVFLFRGTVRSYRRSALAPVAGSPPTVRKAVQFGGGFSVGAVETTEAVIVLLALAAAGYGASALVGAVAAAVVLVVAAAAVHEQIRRIKVPLLRLGGTALLFSFAIFWGGEAFHVAWPGGDLILIPLVLAIGLLVRGVVALDLRLRPPPAAV